MTLLLYIIELVMAQRIALTGSTGFIGYHLKKRLGQGAVCFSHSVHSLCDQESLLSLVDGRSVLIHLAGISRTNNPKDFNRINVDGTRNIVDAAQKAGVKKIIFSSSFAVYEPPVDKKIIITEASSTLKTDNNLYGISKLKAEEVLKRSASDKLQVVVLRIANVYGPGDEKSIVSIIMNRIKDGQEITLHNGGVQTRDFIFVDDVVKAILQAVIFKPSNNFEVLNICSGKQTSLLQLVKLIGEISGERARVRFEKKQGGMGYWQGDNPKARQVLNWEPKISLKKGLKSTWGALK